MYNHKTVETKTLADLSNGEITVNDILIMECMILEALSFNLCPPICCSFLRSFYAFLPPGAKNAAGQDLIKRASFLAELSVMDISFRTLHQSSIAFAAILNALDTMDQNFLLPSEKEHFIRKIECSLDGTHRLQRNIVVIRNMFALLNRRCCYFQKVNTNITSVVHNSTLLLSRVKDENHIDVRDDIMSHAFETETSCHIDVRDDHGCGSDGYLAATRKKTCSKQEMC